jgi:hypothetical protein
VDRVRQSIVNPTANWAALIRLDSMPVKATCIDENRTIHVVIALNREDLNRLMAGGCLNFTVGTALSTNSQIQIAFGETDGSGKTGNNS